MFRRLITRHAPQGAQDLPYEIAELLATLARVSREELADGAARDALGEAICRGEIDGVYRPVARPYHNVTLARLPRDVDPRLTIAQWVRLWLDGKSPRDELLAEHAAAVERGREFWEAREEQARLFLQQRQAQQRQRAEMPGGDA